MALLGRIDQLFICTLDRERAVKHEQSLKDLVSQIPNVSQEDLDVLAESKDGRAYCGKWEHSTVVWNSFHPVGVILAYERTADGINYPINSIYLHQVAVAPQLQRKGIGTEMLRIFLWYNAIEYYRRCLDHGKGFLEMEGEYGNLVFSLQTNAVGSNEGVRRFYQKEGFEKAGMKRYATKTDQIMLLLPQ